MFDHKLSNGMKIAIDVSPLTSGNFLQHRVRGTGFYLRNLRENLLKFHSKNEYEFFDRSKKNHVEADVIHYPYFEPYFLTLPSNIKKNIVVTVHDLTPLVFKENFPSGIKGKIKWKIQKRSLQKCDGIITDSISSKKDIAKYAEIEESKIHVVYLAAADYFKPLVNTSTLRSVKVKYKLPEKFVLYVGDVTWNKNLPGLIRAINRTDFNLVIVGEAFVKGDFDRSNPWNQDLALAQELALPNKKIIALGYVSDRDLAQIYNMATVFVMPSLYEGFGLPVLEAMQSGCPVITSQRGSIPEIGGEAAYYVDPLSADSIVEGIKEVYMDEKIRKKLSQAGLKQAEKFSWKKTVDDTFKVYETVFATNK